MIENGTTDVVVREKIILRNGNNHREIAIPNGMAALLSQLTQCSGASVVIFPKLFANNNGEITTTDEGWGKKGLIKLAKVGRYDTVSDSADYSATYELASDCNGNTMKVLVKTETDGNIAVESLAGCWSSDGKGPNYGFERSYEGTPYEYLACSSFVCNSPLLQND